MGLRDHFNKHTLVEHVIDSSAMLFAGHPIYAAVERYALDKTIPESLYARGVATIAVYGGLGLAYEKGRKLSHKLFGMGEKTHELIHWLHDGIYSFAFNTLASMGIYFATGTRDLEKLTLDSMIVAAAAIPISIWATYALDVARDITGLEPSSRTPEVLKRQPGSVKRKLLPAFVALSIAATAAVYAYSSHAEPGVVAPAYGNMQSGQ
jgi:hypothetical protein